MSIALAPSPPQAAPLSRAERLHALLNRFAVEGRAQAALIADDQGFLVAASDALDGPEGEAWAAAAVHATGAAATVQRMTGYRVSPDAAIKIAPGRHLYASILPTASQRVPLTVAVLADDAPDRSTLRRLAEAVSETLGE